MSFPILRFHTLSSAKLGHSGFCLQQPRIEIHACAIFKCSKLHQLGVISSPNTERVTCATKSACYKVDSHGNKEPISVHITAKEELQGTTTQLVQDVEDELNQKLCRHVFNIRHQYRQFKMLRENLTHLFVFK